MIFPRSITCAGVVLALGIVCGSAIGQSATSDATTSSLADAVRLVKPIKPKDTALKQETLTPNVGAGKDAVATTAAISSKEAANIDKPLKSAGPSAKVILSKASAFNTPKISTIFYDEQTAQEPVRIYARRGFVVHIQFAPAEKIEKCAGGSIDCLVTGDYSGWFISGKAGDRSIFVKPNSSAFNTNLNIITNFYSYSFDLQVLPDSSKSEGNWRVAFAHPQDGGASPQYGEKLLQDRLSSKLSYRRNTKYVMQKIDGSDEIIPSAAWDDGVHTYIRISNNRSKPAIFKVLPDNSEQGVNSHMEGDVIVIQEIARRWVMRLSSSVIGVWNENYDPEGIPPVDGTIVPGVARVIKGEPS